MANQFALVTGTSSGIGAATARQLLHRHWQVIGVARRAASIDHPQYRHLTLDLEDVSAVISTIEREVGPVLRERTWTRVGLVNNAASGALLGPFERIDPVELLKLYAINVATPVWLMGFFVARTGADAALRIVNLSSGSAVRPFPGLTAYSSSKAALRLAGMIVASELDSPERRGSAPAATVIVSYEPGIVDSEMQTAARNLNPRVFPWVDLFRGFQSRGLLVQPDKPAVEIVGILESDELPRFSERRLG